MPVFLLPSTPCTSARVPTAPTAPATIAFVPSIANDFAPMPAGLWRRWLRRKGLLRRRELRLREAFTNGFLLRLRFFFFLGFAKNNNSSPIGFFLRPRPDGRRGANLFLRRGADLG